MHPRPSLRCHPEAAREATTAQTVARAGWPLAACPPGVHIDALRGTSQQQHFHERGSGVNVTGRRRWRLPRAAARAGPGRLA